MEPGDLGAEQHGWDLAGRGCLGWLRARPRLALHENGVLVRDGAESAWGYGELRAVDLATARLIPREGEPVQLPALGAAVEPLRAALEERFPGLLHVPLVPLGETLRNGGPEAVWAEVEAWLDPSVEAVDRYRNVALLRELGTLEVELGLSHRQRTLVHEAINAVLNVHNASDRAEACELVPKVAELARSRGAYLAEDVDLRQQKGPVTVVTLHADRDFSEQVTALCGEGRLTVIVTMANWAPPCRALDAALDDPGMQANLGDLLLVRWTDALPVEPDVLAKHVLHQLSFPALFVMDAQARCVHAFDGGRWGPNVPEEMGPVIARELQPFR